MDYLSKERYNNLIKALCHIRTLIEGIEGTEDAYDEEYLYPDDLEKAKEFLESIH